MDGAIHCCSGEKKEKKDRYLMERRGKLGLGCQNVRVNGKQVNYREKNWILALVTLPQSAGIIQAAVCVCVWIQYTHPRSTAVQTESGRQAETTQGIGHLLLWLCWLEAKVQPCRGETEGRTEHKSLGLKSMLQKNTYKLYIVFIYLLTDVPYDPSMHVGICEATT